MTPEQLLNLLHRPLPELTPPGFDPGQLAGLRSLPSFCAQLKLIYGLKALAPLAEHPALATVSALLLAARILASVGGFASRNPTDTVTLTGLRCAAALTLIDLQQGNAEAPGEDAILFQSPCVVLVEAAEMAQLRRARSAGQSEEIVLCAAGLILELWEFADQFRRTPGKAPGAVIHAGGWASPATEILRKLDLGRAVGEVVPFRNAFGSATQAAAG